MSVDPGHYLASSNGGKPPLLKLKGIESKPELNGRFGQAVSFAGGRYVVAVINAHSQQDQPQFLKLKPENLEEATQFDQLKFGARMMVEYAKEFARGPKIDEYGNLVIAALPSSLGSKLSPKTALLGCAAISQLILLVVLKLVGRVVGVWKVFVFVSMVALVLSIAGPDIVDGMRANKPYSLIAKSAARNLGMRCKEQVAQMTGYRISERMALGLLLALLLFCGKALLTTTTSRPPRSSRTSTPPIPHYDLEYLYKLGFDDATASKEFGASLPDDVRNYNAAVEADLAQPIDQYEYEQHNYEMPYDPQPKAKGSSFGVGSMLSMFTLFRFGKDLVTSPDGQIVTDPAYIMARLRQMESWRLGLLAMSAYRVVKSLGII